MRLYKRSKIIEHCIEEILEGNQNEEECMRCYPEFSQDLQSAFLVLREFQSANSVKLDPLRLDDFKKRLLISLPDRENVVTKNQSLRYRWQNTKWRFAMTWVIIVTTVLSLMSGAGAVYASNDALPGEFLFPVKTWVEDIQLLLAPDDVDVELAGKFASRRIDELIELLQSGEEINLEVLLDAYRNRTELMTQTLEKVQTQVPEDAIRLRIELESRLQEQARLMESLLDAQMEDDDAPNQAHIRSMLEANTQTRLRINQDVPAEEPVEGPAVDSSGEVTTEEPTEEASDENKDQNQYTNQNQNRVEYASDEFVENGALYFQFRFADTLLNEVYAEVNGSIYNCTIDDSLVTCNLTGVSGQGTLKLFDLKTKALLYSYDYQHDYEYLWSGAKEGGNENQQSGGTDQENDDHGNGQGGSDK
jgi:hypothetical protein